MIGVCLPLRKQCLWWSRLKEVAVCI